MHVAIPRNYHFLLIPETGDPVRSQLQYRTPEETLDIAAGVARLTVNADPEKTKLRGDLRRLATQRQSHIEVVVIHTPTKEMVAGDLVRRAG